MAVGAVRTGAGGGGRERRLTGRGKACALAVASLLLAAIAVPVVLLLAAPSEDKALRRFSSEAELASYLDRRPTTPPNDRSGAWFPPDRFPWGWPFFPFSSGLIASGGTSELPGPPADFSVTNNQVEGVDEADMLKTDGTYLYIARNDEVVLVRADPAEEAAVSARISAPGPAPDLLYAHGRLFVISMDAEDSSMVPDARRTWVRAYDVSNPAFPRLIEESGIPGAYLGARLIRDHVYVMASKALRVVPHDGAPAVPLPSLSRGGITRPLQPRDIGYFDDGSPGKTLLTLLAAHTRKTSDWAFETLLVGGAEDLYVSSGHLYVRGSGYRPDTSSSPATEARWGTSIHRIALDGARFRYEASGWVPGQVLNQFAMDEYEGHLRVATTDWRATAVYVLDTSLETVGSVEEIAPGETMHSARFAGDRAYLVTFKKIDPFFVLDVSDPSAPRVLGELKIPGYSDYLHPYDENHVIGLGKDTHDMGSFAWFQGVKLSLFDVRDLANPREVASYVIGDRGTESEALRDHHAFLFSRERNLLVIPIQLAEVPPGSEPSTHGQVSWVGAYVFHADRTGFTLRGEVEHGARDPTHAWNPYGTGVRRSLYIGDSLYTVSSDLVKATDLGTLEEIRSVRLR